MHVFSTQNSSSDLLIVPPTQPLNITEITIARLGHGTSRPGSTSQEIGDKAAQVHLRTLGLCYLLTPNCEWGLVDEEGETDMVQVHFWTFIPAGGELN